MKEEHMNIDRISESVLSVKPAYTDIIRFHAKIFRLQEDYKAKIDLGEMIENELTAAGNTTSDGPLLLRSAFPLDISASKSLLAELCRIEGREVMNEVVAVVRNAVNADPALPEKLFKGVLNDDREIFEQAGAKIDVDLEILEFYGRESIEPSVVYVSERIAEGRPERDHDALKGYCPICGSLPSFALIDDSGKRKLVCAFCKHQWPVNRIYCPWCENTDQKTLKYLSIEQEEAYRISVCEKCNHYIKTIMLDKLPYPFHIGMEMCGTLHLDMISEKNGFLSIEGRSGTFTG